MYKDSVSHDRKTIRKEYKEEQIQSEICETGMHSEETGVAVKSVGKQYESNQRIYEDPRVLGWQSEQRVIIFIQWPMVRA